MEDIYNRGKIPILVGGTGFYIQAVLNDIAFTKEKQGDEITLKLVKNPDIVAGVAALTEHRPYVVGFAAETQNVEEYAKQKLARKNLDMICANDVSQEGQGFNTDTNALHLFWPQGDKQLPLSNKSLLGHYLIDEIVSHYEEKNRR